MTNRKKSNPLRIIAGGKNSSSRSPSVRKSGGRNLLTPQIWLPYRAGHGDTARDRSAAGKNFALLKLAIEERLGTPIRSTSFKHAKINDQDRLCSFCQRKIDFPVFVGPQGNICITCVETGLEKINQREPWPS